MNGLNTARGDFIPVGDGILPPGALLFQAKSRRGGGGKSRGRKCSATPAFNSPNTTLFHHKVAQKTK